MNWFRYTSVVFLLIFAACEKEITLDLPESSNQVVLEGAIYEGEYPELRISKTLDFYDASGVEMLSGAVATFSDNVGNEYLLSEVKQGVYSTTEVQGEIGKNYTLRVEYAGIEYIANSTLLRPQTIDELELEEAPKVAGRTGYSMTVNFSDADDNEFYFLTRVFHRKDNKNEKEERATKQGNIRFNARFEEGQEVKAIVYTIDESVFDYMTGALELTNDGNFVLSSEPSNPKSNWSNGALGYFGAFSTDTASVIVPN